jgi:molybdopterin biosynthesis enzyme
VYKKNNQYFAKLAGGQGSNLMSTVVNANGLATCPETSSRMVPGEKISVEIFDWAEIG